MGYLVASATTACRTLPRRFARWALRIATPAAQDLHEGSEPPACSPPDDPLGWLSAPGSSFHAGSRDRSSEQAPPHGSGCAPGSAQSAPSSGFAFSARCSLKTEQRTKKPVRAITATASTRLVPGQLHRSARGGRTSRDRSPSNSWFQPLTRLAPLRDSERRAPLSRTFHNDRGSPSGVGRDLDGEFDPGSGRTLAACLTHASRAGSIQWQHWGRSSGERVSNT